MRTFLEWLQQEMLGYHSTFPANAQSILQNGFDLNKRRKSEFGAGVYLSPTPDNAPNQVNLECKIHTAGFLFIPSHIGTEERKAYLQKLIPDLPNDLLDKLSVFKFGIDPAANRKIIPILQNKFRGLVIPSQQTIVAYYVEDVKPLRIMP